MLARARAVTLTNYREVARHVGLDPYAMLDQAGLHPTALEDPENWLPASRILALLEASAAQSKRPDFSVLLGESRTFASLGPVSLLLKHESTLRDIISASIEYRRLIIEMLNTHLREDGRTAMLEWNLVPGLQSPQGIKLVTTVAYRILVDGGGVGWQPECIHFRDSAPGHIESFRRVFRCALEFDSDFDGMSFSSSCLDMPNQFADPALTAHARRLLNLMPGVRRADTISERARSTLPLLISEGKADVGEVAKILDVPVRTLQRRLIHEGQSFSGLLNQTRRELAVRYLGNSNRPITAVAQLTGYSALSSFTRWFNSEFGMSPVKWRKMKPSIADSGLANPIAVEGGREAPKKNSLYRLHRSNSLGELDAGEDFNADNDAAAVAEAFRRASGSKAELWRGQHLLVQLETAAN